MGVKERREEDEVVGEVVTLLLLIGIGVKRVKGSRSWPLWTGVCGRAGLWVGGG